MAQAVQKNLDNWQAKLDKVLHEKNVFTDQLEKIEQKSGVRRLYIALGTYPCRKLPERSLVSKLSRGWAIFGHLQLRCPNRSKPLTSRYDFMVRINKKILHEFKPHYRRCFGVQI